MINIIPGDHRSPHGRCPIYGAKLIGIRLDDITATLDPTHISIEHLLRMSVVLDLPLTDLLTTVGVPATDQHAEAPPASPRHGDYPDEQLVEAVLERCGRLGLADLATILGWDPDRASAAVARLDTTLADTVRRLSGTADDLAITFRPGTIDARTLQGIDAHRNYHRQLATHEAERLLHFIRAEVRDPNTPTDHPLGIHDLLERHLVISAPGPRALASANVMFALGLPRGEIHHPAPTTTSTD